MTTGTPRLSKIWAQPNTGSTSIASGLPEVIGTGPYQSPQRWVSGAGADVLERSAFGADRFCSVNHRRIQWQTFML
jgi:hypothetical protein